VGGQWQWGGAATGQGDRSDDAISERGLQILRLTTECTQLDTGGACAAHAAQGCGEPAPSPLFWVWGLTWKGSALSCTTEKLPWLPMCPWPLPHCLMCFAPCPPASDSPQGLISGLCHGKMTPSYLSEQIQSCLVTWGQGSSSPHPCSGHFCPTAPWSQIQHHAGPPTESETASKVRFEWWTVSTKATTKLPRACHCHTWRAVIGSILVPLHWGDTVVLKAN